MVLIQKDMLLVYQLLKWCDALAQEYHLSKPILVDIPDYLFIIVFRCPDIFVRRKFQVVMVIRGCLT